MLGIPMTESSLIIPARDDAREFRTFARGTRVLRAFTDLSITVDQQRVVDLGAGYGSLSIACAREGARDVLAVDANQDRLDAIGARSREQQVDVRTRQANLLDPWDDQANADVVFLIGVVEYAGLWDEHADVRDLQRRVFHTALEVLKPGGLLVFSSKNRLWPRFIFKDVHTDQPLVNLLPRSAADAVSRRLSGSPYRHHIRSPKGWASLIASAGFSQVQTFVPYLSYQFPLAIVDRPSFGDIKRVRRLPQNDEERRAAWGRMGTLKAALMAAAGSAGIQMGSAVVATARKPVR